MWTLVSRVGINFARSTVFRRSYSLRNNRVTTYIRDLAMATNDPLWRLVMTLHYPQRQALSEMLAAHHVPAEQFSHWRPALYASDIDKAITAIPDDENAPSWLVLYLAGFKVHTPQHASGVLMDLSLAHIKAAPPAIQAPLLVVTMMHLARFDLVNPMQRVIDAFLLVPLTLHLGVHFNHFLAAMASVRHRSPETGSNTVKVLRAMEARQVRLWPQMCSTLLEDRYTALQLTSYLRRRMTRLGVVPTAAQLESYLRVYSTDGAIHDARRYAAAIRGLQQESDPTEESESLHVARVSRANTLLIRSQPDSASAFEFLVGLARTTEDRPFSPRPRPPTHLHHVLDKRGIDVYDWTSAFAIAGNDPSINSKTLMRIFRRTRPKVAEFRATVASRTILIRALLIRHEWESAYIQWTKLARSGLAIDDLALSAGLQATTYSGRPAEAFELLEIYSARADAPLKTHFRLRRPVAITASTLNLFMTSLHKILRPDLVFRLWDAMESLYNLPPTAETLRIMLEAAQLTHLLDDSFSGQIALLALKNPFRQPHRPPTTRSEHLAFLIAQAITPYRSGIWRGQPAAATAAQIFHQVVLGSPERIHLAALRPPAHAVRAHAESDSAALTMRLDMRPTNFELPPDILTPDRRAHFPQIMAREDDFCAFIVLLGMTRNAPEIPRTLAWMRALDIKPQARTLGLALAFWGDVSVQPPVLEAMAGRDGNQYEKLVRWLQEWCEEVPDEQTVALWRSKVARVKNQRRQSVADGHLINDDWGR
ncbi:hypothetical protein C8J57DRAFT_295971 [Mycena rebaudengoi]|nr:hypothetical protein C8J57DRAFT_295971 [Mycena rebaudengoi]